MSVVRAPIGTLFQIGRRGRACSRVSELRPTSLRRTNQGGSIREVGWTIPPRLVAASLGWDGDLRQDISGACVFTFCLLFCTLVSCGGGQWLGCLTEIRGKAKPSTLILDSGMRFSGARTAENL